MCIRDRPNLHTFITKSPRSTRSSSVVIFARPPSSSSLRITDRSFRCASPYLWNQILLSLHKPHYGTSSSVTDLSIRLPVTFSSVDSPLCSSITPYLKTYMFHKSYPVVSLLPPGLPSWTIARTVSSELLGFCF